MGFYKDTSIGFFASAVVSRLKETALDEYAITVSGLPGYKMQKVAKTLVNLKMSRAF